MGGALTIVGAVVAVLASVGAVAVVVEQFTLRARLRTLESWAVAALSHDKNGNRAGALTSVRLDATSRIVSGIFVPLRLFALDFLYAAGAVVVAAAAWANVDGRLCALVLTTLFALVIAFLATRRGAFLYLERCRVASHYRRGLPVREAAGSHFFDLVRRPLIEYTFGVGASVGLCAAGLAAGLAISRGEVDGVPLVLGVGGLNVAFGALEVIRSHARDLHPMRADGPRVAPD